MSDTPFELIQFSRKTSQIVVRKAGMTTKFHWPDEAGGDLTISVALNNWDEDWGSWLGLKTVCILPPNQRNVEDADRLMYLVKQTVVVRMAAVQALTAMDIPKTAYEDISRGTDPVAPITGTIILQKNLIRLDNYQELLESLTGQIATNLINIENARLRKDEA